MSGCGCDFRVRKTGAVVVPYIESFLHSGGAEQFIEGDDSWEGRDFYQDFAKAGYNVVHNKTQLEELSGSEKTLGIFTISHL